MNLQLISLTGADDKVDPVALREIAEQFPLVEWAILSSEKRQGSSRYPSEEWVSRFHATCPSVKKAVHLCGNDVDLFLAMDARIHAKVSNFDRVQLNFNQRRNPKDLDQLVNVSNQVAQVIIIQHNSANEDLWAQLRHKVGGLTVLFDASGGGGKSPKDGWPEMLPGTVCGFAGGLGADNIAAEFAAIKAIADDRPFWIDMEGKLRSAVDDSFDLEACREILKHVTQNAHQEGLTA